MGGFRINMSAFCSRFKPFFKALQEYKAISAGTLAKRFANDFVFNQLKRDYKSLLSKYFTLTQQSCGEETAEVQELEKQLDGNLSDILSFCFTRRKF